MNLSARIPTAAVLVGLLATLITAQQIITVPFPNLAGEALENALHIPWFMLVSIMLMLLDERLFDETSTLRVIAVGVAVAAATEAVQAATGRDPSLGDLGLDMVGLLLAFVARASLTRSPARRLAITACLTGLVMVLVCGAPGVYVYAYHERDQQFPTVFDAGSWSWSLLSRSNSRIAPAEPPLDWAYDGRSVKLTWSDNEYPRLTIYEVAPGWHSYRHLTVDLYVLGDRPQTLTIAVAHDHLPGNSRFVTETLAPGPHEWRVPISDLAYAPGGGARRVTKLTLHATAGQAGRAVLLGRMRLEGDAIGQPRKHGDKPQIPAPYPSADRA